VTPDSASRWSMLDLLWASPRYWLLRRFGFAPALSELSSPPSAQGMLSRLRGSLPQRPTADWGGLRLADPFGRWLLVVKFGSSVIGKGDTCSGGKCKRTMHRFVTRRGTYKGRSGSHHCPWFRMRRSAPDVS